MRAPCAVHGLVANVRVVEVGAGVAYLWSDLVIEKVSGGDGPLRDLRCAVRERGHALCQAVPMDRQVLIEDIVVHPDPVRFPSRKRIVRPGSVPLMTTEEGRVWQSIVTFTDVARRM